MSLFYSFWRYEQLFFVSERCGFQMGLQFGMESNSNDETTESENLPLSWNHRPQKIIRSQDVWDLLNEKMIFTIRIHRLDGVASGYTLVSAGHLCRGTDQTGPEPGMKKGAEAPFFMFMPCPDA